MRNAIYRWKNFKDKPTPDSLLKIAQYFGVSVEWLMTGKEPLSENLVPHYEARLLSPVEAELLHQTLKVVEETLKETHQQLLSDQKFRLIIQIYNDCAEDRIKPDSKMVKRYLSVMNL